MCRLPFTGHPVHRHAFLPSVLERSQLHGLPAVATVSIAQEDTDPGTLLNAVEKKNHVSCPCMESNSDCLVN